MSEMLEAARLYAGRGWPIFRLSRKKVPLKDTHAQNDATTDSATIEAWWSGRGRNLNIGLACGDLIVVDADGPGGEAEWAAMCAPHGGIPTTQRVRTRRGHHYYFRKPAGAGDLRKLDADRANKGDDGIDIRAGGSYVVLPPSVNRETGFRYEWVKPYVPIVDLPQWLVDHIVSRGGRRDPKSAVRIDLGARPEWLRAEDLTGRAVPREVVRELPPLADVLKWLRRIPASIGNFEWFRIKCMIRDFDAGDTGLAIFKAWSRTSTRHDWAEAEPACETEWARPEKPLPEHEKLHVWSLEREAEKYPPVEAQEQAKQEFQQNAASAGFTSENTTTFAADEPVIRKVQWADTDKNARPLPTCTNARLAIEGLGVTCRHDTFADRLYVGGHAIQQWAGELSDNAVLVLRRLIREAFRFDPGEKPTRDGAVQACLANQFNPVVDYLAALQWDGRARIGRWVVDYLGCSDNLECEFGRLMLIAAVRRARQPGTKFDQIIVMEGAEGTGKSTALRILGGEHFSDQRVLGMREREQQEASAGVWIHEIAELAGMRRAEVEHVKAFASRQEDRARPSYGRFRVDRPRQTVFAATTNATAYLKSDTGDRRFWPLATTRIDLDGLRRDRDQLWAEAAVCEARGDSIALDPRFYGLAAQRQAERQELDPWTEDIAKYVNGHEDTSIADVLSLGLRIEIGHCGQVEMSRAARVLRNMGFLRYQSRDGNARMWRYRRETTK